MAHYTADIVLEEVAVSAFNKMKEYWNLVGFNTRDDSVQARILNPLAWPILSDRTETYHQFIEFLLDNKWLDQISVNDHGRWIKRYSRKMNAAEIINLAGIAANSTFERNCFEIRFKDPTIPEPVNRPSIEFREHQFRPDDLRIVGYQATVPAKYIHLFNASLQEEDFYLIQGLWVPEDINLKAKDF